MPDWKKYNQNFIGVRLPEGLTKEDLDKEATSRNLKDRTALIINAIRQYISPESTNTASTSNNIFKQAFQELYRLFESFSHDPTSDIAIQLFEKANLQLIDKAKEALAI